tara:strand:- start:1748 stop:1924 length:177 start_codon:yes stop_codon:yes gene_type:complete
MPKFNVKFLWNETEYDMMVECAYKSDAKNVCKQIVREVDGIDIIPLEVEDWIEKDSKK